MAWTSPQYSKTVVDRAGQTLISDFRSREDLEQSFQIISNWRSSHSFPLNTFQMSLRKKAGLADSSSLVAQRIKRLSSIEAKLRNEGSMQLSRMQDIGGCRAVLGDVPHVRRLRESYEEGHLKHRLVKENDYIASPKASGYRSLHRVYRYFSDKNDTYNGLQIEIQMRSQLQHAWATAVETVDTFLGQSLKASRGSEDWLRFFSLMGSALAVREGTPLVPGTPDSHAELRAEIRDYATSLDVDAALRAYGLALKSTEMPEARGARYFLMELRPTQGSIKVTAYTSRHLSLATQRYLEVERALVGRGAEAVLVSVDSLSVLRRAYPNYFLDSNKFLAALDVAISH